MDIEKFFSESLKSSGIKAFIDENSFLKLLYYLDELVMWNKKFNLIGLDDKREIISKLFIDSLHFIKINTVSHCETVLDIGSGAGFPGIPNAIILKNKRFFLIESNKKKCSFLEHITNKLELKNISIINERVEILSNKKSHRENYDCAILKAFNPFNVSVELTIPLLKINGFLIFFASKNQEKSILNNINLQKILNFKIENIITYELPDNNGTRSLIIVKKLWKTNDAYPRKYNIIKTKPLK